jgi:DNA-directed RNA polymerase specialized sigma24 family protein
VAGSPGEDEWSALYRNAFPTVYRALVAVLFDREAALDAIHDAFEQGLRKPDLDRRNIEG